MKQSREEKLANLILDYQEAEIGEICADMINEVTPWLEQIGREMAVKYDRPVVQYMTSRIKTPESTFNKLVRKRRGQTMLRAVETLHDLAGIRVVCSFQDDVYHVVKAIKKLPGLEILNIKDYITHPKSTGYRSIHIITEVPSCGWGLRLEIQVCSAAMNYWAMLGHQLSYKTSIDPEKLQEIEQELKSYAYEIADIDKKFLKIRKVIEKL